MGRKQLKDRSGAVSLPLGQPANRRGLWLRAAVIVVAILLTYANSLSHPLMFDDDGAIAQNAQIRDWRPSTSLFPRREAPTAGRPVVNASFALNYAIGGLNVVGYHVVNVGVHVLCALVLFGLTRRTLALPGIPAALQEPSVDIALAVAAIWAVHPLNSEAVDYLTQRTESLMAFFYLLTMYCALRTATAENRWPIGAVASCAIGMACKESMVTAPLAVLLFDRVFLYRSTKDAWRQRGVLYGGLAATWAVLAAAIWSGPRIYSAGFQSGVSSWTYLLNQTVMIARYLRLAVWPSALVLAYGNPQTLSLGDVAPQALLVVALIALTIVALVRWPRVGFLGAWFFLTLAPTSSIVPIATEVGAERRMYLPLAALVALAVVGAVWLSAEGLRRSSVAKIAGWLSLAVVSTSLAVVTIRRNREYASSLGMAETVLARWPTAFAHTMVGVELAAAGRHDEAIGHLRDAAPAFPRARYHLGGELYNGGHYEDAIEQLQAFVRAQPLAMEAVRARTMLGRAYLATGKTLEASEQLRLVQSMTAPSSDAHVTATGFLADALFAERRFADAAPLYRAFLSARPDDIGGLTNYGICLANTGQHDEATTVFRRASQLHPADTMARANLVRALFNEGQIDAASSEATELVRQHPEYGGGHALLGRALASRGHLAGARAEFERALQIDPHDDQSRADLDLVRRAGQRGR